LQEALFTQNPREKNETIANISKITDKSKKGLQDLPIELTALTLLVKTELAKMDIRTVWQLCSSTEHRMQSNPHLIQGGIDEIIAFLAQNGLTLALRA
jgi:DNA-directed RNA polymerase alpha subunit